MATDLSASFNERYININTKLKKRFMRKPNISEATNEFIGLAIQCEHSEQPAFAGQTYIGAAKCEASAGNALGEAEHYMSAARQFMKAEKKLVALKFYSPDRENLEAAIGCYKQALSKYPNKSPIRMSILLELASELVHLDQKLEAATYYKEAIDLIQDKTLKLTIMKDYLNLMIECGKYERALETANEMCDSNYYIPKKLLTELEISRVLLSCLVEIDKNTDSKSLSNLLTNLMDYDEGEIDMPFNTDLCLKLQSIMILNAQSEHDTLVSIAVDAKPYLSLQQRQLLDSIIFDKKLY